MELIILIGLVSTVAAGFACVAEHGYAARHGWGLLERYGVGAATWLVAFAAPTFAALPVEQALLLYSMAWLIIGGMGLATWIAYRPPLTMLSDDEDELEAKINRALGEK